MQKYFLYLIFFASVNFGHSGKLFFKSKIEFLEGSNSPSEESKYQALKEVFEVNAKTRIKLKLYGPDEEETLKERVGSLKKILTNEGISSKKIKVFSKKKSKSLFRGVLYVPDSSIENQKEKLETLDFLVYKTKLSSSTKKVGKISTKKERLTLSVDAFIQKFQFDGQEQLDTGSHQISSIFHPGVHLGLTHIVSPYLGYRLGGEFAFANFDENSVDGIPRENNDALNIKTLYGEYIATFGNFSMGIGAKLVGVPFYFIDFTGAGVINFGSNDILALSLSPEFRLPLSNSHLFGLGANIAYGLGDGDDVESLIDLNFKTYYFWKMFSSGGVKIGLDFGYRTFETIFVKTSVLNTRILGGFEFMF